MRKKAPRCRLALIDDKPHDKTANNKKDIDARMAYLKINPCCQPHMVKNDHTGGQGAQILEGDYFHENVNCGNIARGNLVHAPA